MRVLTQGTRLSDRYTLIRKLGGGGMAEVWLADDQRSDSRVALKFLHADLGADARRRELFHNEWRLASRLMHAHIARTFEYHDDTERPFFALQYLEGPPFAELAGLSLEQKLRPFGLLADALRYAHGKDVVHGDVKADNVLFDSRGAPYLIDFGVAGSAGSAAPGGGTPIAQSPQQRANEAATAADDIYALAVLMHEVITGAPPAGSGAVAGSDAHGDKLPQSLYNLLQSMLAERRTERPTAEQVRARLDAAGFAAGSVRLAMREAASSEPESLTVQTIKPSRHTTSTAAPAQPVGSGRDGLSPALVGAGLLVLLLIVVGVVFVLPDAVNDAPPTAAPPVAAATEDPAAAPEVVTPEGTTPATLPGDRSGARFGENLQATGSDRAARIKAATDEALGDLLSRLERLRYRGIERWGGQEYLDAIDRYAAGDEAYLAKNYRAAGEHYRAATVMLEPFFDRIDAVFRQTLEDAKAAFEAEDFREAIRLYDLAATITPGNATAERGLVRARNLEDVLSMTERGLEFEKQLELEAARQAYERVLDLDPAWSAATQALERVRAALEQRSFEQRMTEGFDALAADNYDSARAAFEAAKAMRPQSTQPGDGLLQVDQEVRLLRMRSLEQRAETQVENEQWEAAVETYRDALSVDGDLQFAKDGLRHASQRAALHAQLQEYIENPDTLSAPQTMQAATNLLLQLSRVTPDGPRLIDQKEALSRLLKRAATPLTVHLVSDNKTEVSIFRVGKLGTFDNRRVDLRPGSYVAVGSRPGFRDVRLEFRVAPEVELQPIVVECEEPI